MGSLQMDRIVNGSYMSLLKIKSIPKLRIQTRFCGMTHRCTRKK